MSPVSGSSNYAPLTPSTRYWSATNCGGAITYNQNHTAGNYDTWTINQKGIYSIILNFQPAGSPSMGVITRNYQNQQFWNATGFNSILGWQYATTTGGTQATYTGPLNAGDVLQIGIYLNSFEYTSFIITLLTPSK